MKQPKTASREDMLYLSRIPTMTRDGTHEVHLFMPPEWIIVHNHIQPPQRLVPPR